MMRWFVPALLVLLFACLFLLRQQGMIGKDAPAVLQDRSDRRIVQLSNGLIVVAQSISTAPVVHVQCRIRTGSIYEQQHNGAGLSHFLEHLVSGGTTSTRTEAESVELLGRIGAQTNAATSLDSVWYYINTSSEHAPVAIDLISDWMQHSVITREEFDREREVIQREFDMGRGDPGRIFWKLTQQARYRAHPARHPTIGYIDEFLTITREEVYDFYKTMYVPNNMVFVVAGDIDIDETLAQVAKLWADADAGELPEIRFPVEPTLEHPVEVTGQADVRLPKLRLAWPGTRLGGEHDYALDLLAGVVGGGDLSRLVKTVRDGKQLVTSVSAYNFSMPWGEGFFGVDATTTPDQLEAARAAILAEVERIRDEGVTDDELARAKSRTIAGVVFASQTAQATASRLAGDILAKANPDYLPYYAEQIVRLTRRDLHDAARAVLRDKSLMTITLMPADEPTVLKRPAEPTETFPIERVDLDNAATADAIRALSAVDDATDADVGPLEMHTLDNGLRVCIQRNTRLPIVAMQWYHLGGLLFDRPGQEGVANAMAAMMPKGAGNRSADDIARLLEETGARLAAASGSNTYYVSAEALRGDWKAIFELMGDVIARPSFPDGEWAKIQPRLLAQIRSANDRWSQEMFNHFNALWYGDHPWSQMTIGRAEVVEALTAEELADYHRMHLDARKSVLAIVGDVDPAEALAEARRVFGALPTGTFAEYEPPAVERGPVGVFPRSTNKPMVAVQIGFGPTVGRNHRDYSAIAVMTKVLSNFPSGWLQKALRGDGPGLVYASWGFHRTGVVPGYWTIAFNTDPARANLAIDRAMQVVERIKAEPVDGDTLHRAINAARVGEVMGRQSNSQLAGAAALDELYGIDIDEIEALRSVTAEQVQQVARKYLTEPLVIVMSNTEVELDAD